MSTTISAGTATSGSAISSDTSGVLALQSGSTPTTAVTIDTAQNVGVGVTPSTWTSYKAIQIGGVVNSFVGNTGGGTDMVQNAYYNSGWKYASTGAASIFDAGDLIGGGFAWRIAPSGTVGNAVTFTTAMALQNNGQFLLGTTTQRGSCSFTLSTDSGTTQWSVGPYLSNSGQFYVASSGSTGVYLNGTSATSWSSNSDERLKTDLVPIANAVTKVNSLRSVTGRYNTDPTGTSRTFLIAQDVQAVLPEAVGTFQIPESEDKTEYLSLAYQELIPLLVASIKELSAEVTALKAKVGA